jgi:hypothetical protein
VDEAGAARSNEAWFLGSANEWVRSDPVAVEHYRVDGWPDDAVNLVPLGVLAAVLVVPAVLLGRAGIPVGLVGLLLAARAIRRMRGQPNDAVIVLTESELVLLHAQCTMRRGWHIKGVLGRLPGDSLALLRKGELLDIEVRLPQGEVALLTPSWPSPAASKIAAALASEVA